MAILQRRLSDPFDFERGPAACLLVHGFAGSPAEVRPLGEHLAARGISVRAPLLPGHGTHPDDLRKTGWPQWVRAAESELADLAARHEAVHVVGFSMGGLIALYLAAHWEVASVVTLSAPIKLADWRQIFVPLLRHFIKDYPARISNPALAAQMDSYDRFPVAAIHSLLHLAKQVRKDLPRVTAPLLAVQGDRDRWIVPESADFIVGNCNSLERRMRILSGRGHLVTLEHGRDELFRQVYDWISLQPQTAP